MFLLLENDIENQDLDTSYVLWYEVWLLLDFYQLTEKETDTYYHIHVCINICMCICIYIKLGL